MPAGYRKKFRIRMMVNPIAITTNMLKIAMTIAVMVFFMLGSFGLVGFFLMYILF